MKKKQENKQEKTVTAHEKAFKAAEKKTRHQLAQVSSFLFDINYHVPVIKPSTCSCIILFTSL